MRVYGLDWAGPEQGQVTETCECGNEPSGSVKCGEFLDQRQTSQILKKDSAPCSKEVCKSPWILAAFIYRPLFEYITIPQSIIKHKEFTKCVFIMMSRTHHSLWDAIQKHCQLEVRIVTAMRRGGEPNNASSFHLSKIAAKTVFGERERALECKRKLLWQEWNGRYVCMS